MQCSIAWKSLNRSTKEEHLLKHSLEKKQSGDGQVSKQKGGEAASPTNREKCRAGKRKTKSTDHPSNSSIGAKNTCLLHGPGLSENKCKVIKFYSEKYAAQQLHKPT